MFLGIINDTITYIITLPKQTRHSYHLLTVWLPVFDLNKWVMVFIIILEFRIWRLTSIERQP